MTRSKRTRVRLAEKPCRWRTRVRVADKPLVRVSVSEREEKTLRCAIGDASIVGQVFLLFCSESIAGHASQ